MRAWISVETYASIMEQAAKNNGRAIVESRGSAPLEILVDVEYAKKEWAEFEKVIDRFNAIPLN
jgi:hypothetical protein